MDQTMGLKEIARSPQAKKRGERRGPAPSERVQREKGFVKFGGEVFAQYRSTTRGPAKQMDCDTGCPHRSWLKRRKTNSYLVKTGETREDYIHHRVKGLMKIGE